MAWKTIVKLERDWKVIPNLRDYDQTCASFSWRQAREELDGLPEGRGLNIAHEAVDRHAATIRWDQVAIRWLGKSGKVEEYTFADLRTLTNQFANVLQHLGVGKGDRVYALAGRIPELYGEALARKYDLSALRFAASVGEPLNPEAVVWGERALGRPLHDNWWQTETGGIMISNFASMDIRPGSMGRPLPGIEAAIVRKTGDGKIEAIEDPNVQGELALRTGWPSMFRGSL